MSANPRIIPVWLRDTYATILPGRRELSTDLKVLNDPALQVYFTSGDVLYSWFDPITPDVRSTYTIVFIIVGLRNLYWTNRKWLSSKDFPSLHAAMATNLPYFANNLLASGELTPFDIVRLPIKEFIALVNNKEPVQLKLEISNNIIQLQYEDYDFWNKSSGKMVNYIPLPDKQ